MKLPVFICYRSVTHKLKVKQRTAALWTAAFDCINACKWMPAATRTAFGWAINRPIINSESNFLDYKSPWQFLGGKVSNFLISKLKLSKGAGGCRRVLADPRLVRLVEKLPKFRLAIWMFEVVRTFQIIESTERVIPPDFFDSPVYTVAHRLKLFITIIALNKHTFRPKVFSDFFFVSNRYLQAFGFKWFRNVWKRVWNFGSFSLEAIQSLTFFPIAWWWVTNASVVINA